MLAEVLATIASIGNWLILDLFTSSLFGNVIVMEKTANSVDFKIRQHGQQHSTSCFALTLTNCMTSEPDLHEQSQGAVAVRSGT